MQETKPKRDIKKIRARVFVSGKVQGVFFRLNTKNKAEELDIFGLVKNLKDGRVEAVFEGKNIDIEKMIDWIKQGPVGAKTETVKVIWEDYTGKFTDFQIKYNN